MTVSLRLDRLMWRLLLAVALGAFTLVPYTRIGCALLIAGLVPGFVVAVRCRLPVAATIGLATAISPVLFGALVFAAMGSGLSATAASWTAAAVWTALFVVGGGTAGEAGRGERRALMFAIAIAVVAGALALTLPLVNEWWRVRSDSWFHAAVFNRISLHGLPPVDPYFSPLRLQYMYFYHLVLIGVATIARTGPFYAMILLNAVAIAGYALAFNWLAGHFSRRAGVRLGGLACAFFAMNGCFYLFFPLRLVRALVGETRGGGVLSDLFPWSPPGHATALALLSVEGNQAFLLDKFMLGTALSLTLPLLAALFALLIRARRGRWSGWSDVALFVVMAGLLFLHTVIGVAAWIATIAVIALLMIVRARTDPGGPSYGRIALLCAGAALIAVPYLFSVRPPGTGELLARVAILPRQVAGLLADVLPVVLLAIPFLRWTERQDRRELLTGRLFGELSLSATGIVFFWILAVLGMGLTVDLVANNETKFSFLLFVPLAALAVGGLERMWNAPGTRRAAVGFIILVTVPLHALYFLQAWWDPSVIEITDEERAVYAWIRHNTDIDALVLDHPDIVRVPVLAARDQYWGTEAYARNWGYTREEMDARRALRDSVYTEGALTDEQRGRLRALGRPVYVISRRSTDDGANPNKWFDEDRRYRGRFVTSEVAVFELMLGEATTE